jgi:hypothetical protein
VRRYQNQGITLPLPKISPESNASPSPTDDDGMSYTSTSSVHDEFQHTHLSTPETHYPWPTEGEQYCGWTSQDSMNTIAVSPRLQWSWTATSPISQPTTMHSPPHNGYIHVPNFATPAAYDAYGGTPETLSPNPTQSPGIHVRGPTHPPIAMTTTDLPYRDSHDVSHLMRCGVQRSHPFQY